MLKRMLLIGLIAINTFSFYSCASDSAGSFIKQQNSELLSLIAENADANLGLSIAGYTTDIILCKGIDGTLYCTKSGDLKTMDRDGGNVKVIYNFAINGYSGHNIQNAIILPSGTMIVCLNAYDQTLKFLRSTNLQYTAWEVVNTDWNGSMLYHGWDVSPDGTVLAGEYPTGSKILTVRLWKITNDGRNWSIIHTFNGRQGTLTTEKQIFHIHTACYDRYMGLFWIGTGDNNLEPSVWTYDGTKMTLIGEGTQLWRSCSFSFTPDYVLWGTDGGIWVNRHYQCYMVRLNRKTNELELLLPTFNCIFNCEPISTPQYNLFLACGTPNGIFLSLDGRTWKEVLRLRLNPDMLNSYSWFYNFVDNKDGRVFAYITGIMREDNNQPLANGGTVILDLKRI